jgi:hypothetical protein
MSYVEKTVGPFALIVALLFQSTAFAQPAGPVGPDRFKECPAGLDAAIAAQDTTTINAIIAANLNNARARACAATALLAAAEAARASNPILAGLLAAEAFNTGALDEKAAQRALNIVGSNPTALALLTNPNAPHTGGNSVDNNFNLGPGNPLGNTVNQSQILTGSPN